jgi:hypothetical protein
LRITLDHRQFAVSKGPDGFGFAIEVVIMDLADEDSARVFLDQVNLAVEISVALNFDNLMIFVSSN